MDLKQVSEKCPAFKNGCPYKDIEINKDELKKCPAFSSGCPYSHDTDWSKFLNHIHSGATVTPHGKCPAFEKGCPFAALAAKVQEDLKKCPSFKSGCPFSGHGKAADAGTPSETEAAPVATEAAPVSGGGCPFSGHNKDSATGSAPAAGGVCPFSGLSAPFKSAASEDSAAAVATHADDAHASIAALAHECPAFKNGCPWKGSVDSLKEQLHKCPAFQSGCPFKNDTTLQQLVSHASTEHAADLAKKCPAFKSGCPYKDSFPALLEKMKSCPSFKSGCPFSGTHGATPAATGCCKRAVEADVEKESEADVAPASKVAKTE